MSKEGVSNPCDLSQLSETHLEVPGFDNTDVSGDSVSELHLDHVSKDQVLGAQRQLLALTDDGGELRNHVLEGLHDFGALGLLVVREDTGHDDDGGKYNTQVKIVVGRLIAGTRLDGVGDEAQDGADPQQQREATEQIFTELDPFRGLFGRRQRIRAIALQVLLGFGVTQTLRE